MDLYLELKHSSIKACQDLNCIGLMKYTQILTFEFTFCFNLQNRTVVRLLDLTDHLYYCKLFDKFLLSFSDTILSIHDTGELGIRHFMLK